MDVHKMSFNAFFDYMNKILCTYCNKSRPSLDICLMRFHIVLFSCFYNFVCCVKYYIICPPLHCLYYLLKGNICLYKYLLLTFMHKGSRPMYLSDIKIQLSGAKSHSKECIIN